MPEFLSPQPGDQAEVLEEARAGTAVYHAGEETSSLIMSSTSSLPSLTSSCSVASDPDDPNTANGKIVYSFPDDGTIVRDLFTIDPNTGDKNDVTDDSDDDDDDAQD